MKSSDEASAESLRESSLVRGGDRIDRRDYGRTV
jgi:hypothetical protein